MNRKNLLNLLELAYAPITAYEFAIIKDDFVIETALEQASLYALGQRPVITFENVVPDIHGSQLYFEIHQKGNNDILKCQLPLLQSIFGLANEDSFGVSFNFLDRSATAKYLPLNNIHGFSLFKRLEQKDEFLIWFSPEKLLKNWWKGEIECHVIGEFRSFIKYKIHYFGKATKQSILKRLAGHSTFQDILSLEEPVTKKQLPANEIVMLPFQFQGNLQIQSFGQASALEDLVAAVNGDNYPNQEKVFLDAEKALIKAMKPGYNKELFNKYPVSKDGLYLHDYDALLYAFTDPITLIYKEGEFSGESGPYGGDAILVRKNQQLELIKRV